MDKKVEILLSSKKNVNSVDQEYYDRVELKQQPTLLHEYEVSNIISATKVFTKERQTTPVYRIYGRIEYLSLLNGLKDNYWKLEDFFNPQYNESGSKNIFNSFDFYLVKPAPSGYTQINTTTFLRYFQVIATPDDFELFNAAYSNNVYDEQIYTFVFNKDFDVTNYFDEFGFPVTELYLYAQFKKTEFFESILRTRWSTSTGDELSPEAFTAADLNIDDYVKTSLTNYLIGDKIEYDKLNYDQYQLAPQIFYVNTVYEDGILQWKYNPFIPIRLRYLSSDLYKANTGNTVYEQVQSIPLYATSIGDGNFVWRKILEQGFIDPLTNKGVNYPFINGKRYLFAPLILDVQPNLNHAHTLEVFQDVWFSRYATPLTIKPISDINNIGKTCKQQRLK